MSNNVVELFENADKPLHDAVEALLPAIKKGEVRGFIAIAFMNDDFEYLLRPGEVSELELIGALEILKNALIAGPDVD